MVNFRREKFGSVVFTAYLIFTAFFAEYFILTHINHEHDHDEADGCCSTCRKIERALALLEGLERAGIIVLSAVLVICIENHIKKSGVDFYMPASPVSLKVRLNS